MTDRHPTNTLVHMVKFRLGEPEHARLAQQAAALRLRVNELARRIVTEKSRRSVEVPALDPAIVIQLQAVGVRLREILSSVACDAGLHIGIGDLLVRIESLLDHAISGEASS
jgi:hypothetical protein